MQDRGLTLPVFFQLLSEKSKKIFKFAIVKKYVVILRQQYGFEVGTGVFGADMKVSLLNDGPVTIILDTDKL